jgi:hypothetical protein
VELARNNRRDSHAYQKQGNNVAGFTPQDWSYSTPVHEDSRYSLRLSTPSQSEEQNHAASV